METPTIYVGIDIAKDSFVAAYQNLSDSHTYHNTPKGIQAFITQLTPQCWCIMEATGSYSIRLALALCEAGFNVSVINPLQIKRFAQTKLKRTKTDQIDAFLIAYKM